MRNDLIKTPVLHLKHGDRVHERNADWPQPFSGDEIYIYTVAEVDRINADTVHVAIETDSNPSAITYEPSDHVLIEPR